MNNQKKEDEDVNEAGFNAKDYAESENRLASEVIADNYKKYLEITQKCVSATFIAKEGQRIKITNTLMLYVNQYAYALRTNAKQFNFCKNNVLDYFAMQHEIEDGENFGEQWANFIVMFTVELIKTFKEEEKI